MNILKALILWLYIPVLLVKDWKITVTVIVAILFLRVATSSSKAEISNSAKKTFADNNKEFVLKINDLTPAFKTGIAKNVANQYIIIHHTASNGANRISDIAKSHLGERQWSKIGYHYFIDNDNNIWQLLPENEVCPNAYHRNNDAVAICIAGNYSTKTVNEKTKKVLAALCKDIMKRNGIHAENVMRHRDVPDNNTECCGDFFNIENFRKRIKND